MLHAHKVHVPPVHHNFTCTSRNSFYAFFYLKSERKTIKGIMYNTFNIVMESSDTYLTVSC